MLHIPTMDFYCATMRLRRPVEERQRPHNLKANLPFVAVRQLANEHVLVGCHPIGMLVGQLFQHVEGAFGDQPIVIVSKRREIGDQRNIRASYREDLIRARD